MCNQLRDNLSRSRVSITPMSSLTPCRNTCKGLISVIAAGEEIGALLSLEHEHEVKIYSLIQHLNSDCLFHDLRPEPLCKDSIKN